jgi:hypothetical protein
MNSFMAFDGLRPNGVASQFVPNQYHQKFSAHIKSPVHPLPEE